MYFRHCRVNICYCFLFVTCSGRVPVTLFPLEEREWLFASRNMTVSSRVWLSENDFRRVLVDESLL